MVMPVPLHYRLFVPSTKPAAGGAPLLVALHGCTQTASDFAAGTRFDAVAERHGAFVVYPEQPLSSNPQRCWNWFLSENQSRASGEPERVLELVRGLQAKYPIDPERVFVAGLSAGGAFAAVLAEQAPDLFAAVGIMAGVSLHASCDVASAFAAMRGDGIDDLAFARAHAADEPAIRAGYTRLRVMVWTGIDDRRVAPQNAVRLAHQFSQLLGAAVEDEREDRDGIEIDRFRDDAGEVRVELWRVPRIGHAWSGGSFRGSHTAPSGPRASDEMMAFFLRPSRSRLDGQNAHA